MRAISLLFTLAVASAAVLAVGVVVIFATQHRASAKTPDYRVVRVDGIEYQAMQGRPLHPGNPVDRAIVGRPRVGARETLFGAFIGVTNDSSTPRPTSGRIALRDQAGHVYRPLPLPTADPYAYKRRVLRPGARIPAGGSRAADDLAATGELLAFRIPAKAYSNGQALELVIRGRDGAASLII